MREIRTAALACRDAAKAEAAIDRQLAQAIRDVGALLLKGLLRERAGDARAAISFALVSSRRITPAPTVPRPAMAIRSGFAGEFGRGG